MPKRKGLQAKRVSDGSGFIQKLKGRMHVTSTNITEVTTFLQDNHAKPVRANKIKDEAFYKTIYSDHSIVIHNLEVATIFLGKLDRDVLGSHRTIRIIGDDFMIWNNPDDVLAALRPIFACPPARSMGDVQLTACRMPPIVLPNDPFAPTRSRKFKSYPCFVVQGIVGCKVALLVRWNSGQNPVTERVMDWCLNQGVDQPKVNLMDRLPAELRDMVYVHNIPNGGTEIIRYEGKHRADRKNKDLLWGEFFSMICVCPAMSAQVIAFVSKKCTFTLRMDGLRVDTQSPHGLLLGDNFKAVAKSLPSWLLAQLAEVQMCLSYQDYYIHIREPLFVLVNNILSKVRPEAQIGPVQITHTNPADPSPTQVAVHLATVPDLRINLIFQELASNFWQAPLGNRVRDEFIAAQLRALKLNMKGYHSYAYRYYPNNTIAIIEGPFDRKVRFSAQDKKFLLSEN
ncbi:hypothetical protein MMC30_003614 [Trapelia coarctata]|nr:hypothetical protein [Trapelia coarctata]